MAYLILKNSLNICVKFNLLLPRKTIRITLYETSRNRINSHVTYLSWGMAIN